MVERQANPAANRAAVAAVDAIEDDAGRVTIVPEDGCVWLRGWALDAGAQAFAEVEFDVGGARASGPCELSRPDVAALFGSPDRVGFRVELALDGAALGHHGVVMHGLRADGSRVPIPLSVSLDVVPPLRRLPAGVVRGALVGYVDELAVPVAGISVDGKAPAVVPAASVLIVRGWAATPEGVPANMVFAEIDEQRVVRGMCGYARPDVAAEFGAAGAAYGFRLRLATDEIGVGQHVLRVHAVAGNTIGAIGGEIALTVAPPERPRVLEPVQRLRGRIDLVGRLDGTTTLLEERTHLRLRTTERAVITGWAGDPVARALPTRVMLAVDGVAHGPVQRGIERDDVAAGTECEPLRTSGFSAVVRAGELGVGFHRAELIALYGTEPVVFDAFSFEVIA